MKLRWWVLEFGLKIKVLAFNQLVCTHMKNLLEKI